jgi:hypothetical protein
MKQVAEFKQYAADCRQMAREAMDTEAKRRLLEMATAWTLLAQEREARITGRGFPKIDL